MTIDPSSKCISSVLSYCESTQRHTHSPPSWEAPYGYFDTVLPSNNVSCIICTWEWWYTISYIYIIFGDIFDKNCPRPKWSNIHVKVNCLKITPDKQFLAAAGNPKVRLFEINGQNSSALVSYDGHTTNVTDLGEPLCLMEIWGDRGDWCGYVRYDRIAGVQFIDQSHCLSIVAPTQSIYIDYNDSIRNRLYM